MTDMRLPTDEQLWICMSETMRSDILPCLEDPWARVALIRLIGLAEYAPKRGDDPTDQRVGELVHCIDQLAARYSGIKEQLPSQWPSDDAATVFDLSSRLLVDAVGDTSEQAESLRSELKTLLLAQLDEDLAVTGPLIASFGGLLNEK